MDPFKAKHLKRLGAKVVLSSFDAMDILAAPHASNKTDWDHAQATNSSTHFPMSFWDSMLAAASGCWQESASRVKEG